MSEWNEFLDYSKNLKNNARNKFTEKEKLLRYLDEIVEEAKGEASEAKSFAEDYDELLDLVNKI